MLGASSAPVARRPRAKYERGKGDALRWGLKTSEEIRDIGPPPKIANARRRQRAVRELAFFLKTYFPRAFKHPFSQDHLRMIEVLSRVATEGGLSAFAMPRGQGKTQIVIRTAIWAVVSGRRSYVSVIGATERASRKILKAIKTELTSNALLYADFPRELHGIPQLQGDNRKALKQLCEGRQTHPRVGNDEIIFPTIPGSSSSGAHISSCGITGNVRGQFHTLETGEVLRPDFAILDDPQTHESAGSPIQTNDRLEIVTGDVLGLAGPDVDIACVVPCTVIAANDLADKLLKDEHWQSIRTKTIYSFPTNTKLWDEYFALRAEELRTSGTVKKATAFYRSRRAEFDAGGSVAWEHRKGKLDISALQSAMHKWHQSPTAFAAEYQNDPIDENASSDAPTFAGVGSKLTRLPRGLVPAWAHWLTVGIDVQLRYLVYVVLASAPGFSCSIVDYGAWPDQSRSYFTRSDAHPTLESESRSSQRSGALWWGLESLTDRLFGRTWQQDNRGVMSITKGLVDAGDGNVRELIFNFCRQSKFSGLLMPSLGEGIGARSKPMAEFAQRPGERLGQDWIEKPPENYRAVRYVRFDTNSWKTFMADRAKALPGETGTLELFGERPEQHRMLFDHLAGESPTQTFGRGRPLWEWTPIPNRENDYLDSLVMAGVAASIVGAALDNMPSSAKRTRRTLTTEEIKARRASQRGFRR